MAESMLEREYRDLLALSRFSQEISGEQDLRGILRAAGHLWNEVAQSGYLAYWEEEGEHEGASLVLKHESLPDPKWLGPLGQAEELFAQALEERKVIYLPGLKICESLPSLALLCAKLGPGSAAIVPVLGASRVRGLLVLADFVDDPSPLLSRIEALHSLGAQLAAARELAYHREEVEAAYNSLDAAKEQLIHAEKFAAVGVLSAEIAHEINNPASFVISNLSVMKDYVSAINEYMGEVDELLGLELSEAERQARYREIRAAKEIDYIQEDFESLLGRSLAGMQRIHQIVRDLRHFAHQGPQEPDWVEWSQLVGGAIALIQHEAKYCTRLSIDVDGAPAVFSDANMLSQVVLNLLVNAIQAIEPGAPGDNEIRIYVEDEGDEVVLFIEDSGKGIEPEVCERIFEPFFTTKDPRLGTGLGLSISRDIVASLGGDLEVESQVGVGTTMKMRIPVRAPRFAREKRIRESGSYKVPPASRWKSNDGEENS